MTIPDIPPQPQTNAAAALRVALLAFATFGYMAMWTYMENNAGRYIEASEEKAATHSRIDSHDSEKLPGVIQHAPTPHVEALPDFAMGQALLRDLSQECTSYWNSLQRGVVAHPMVRGLLLSAKQQPPTALTAILDRVDQHIPLSLNLVREIRFTSWPTLMTKACDQIRISMAKRLRNEARNWMRIMAARWQTTLPRISHETGHEEKRTR